MIPANGSDKDEDWDKAIGQLKMVLNTRVLKPLRRYGQSEYVDMALEEIISLSIQLHHRLSGIDEPYHVNEDKLRT